VVFAEMVAGTLITVAWGGVVGVAVGKPPRVGEARGVGVFRGVLVGVLVCVFVGVAVLVGVLVGV